jgi:hypothetical protein
MNILVDCIAQYQNDWEQISKIVGKTPDQCVMKFVQMPLTENMLSKI